MSGEFAPLVLLGLVIVTFWLSLYVFGLVCLGKWLAGLYRLKVSRYVATLLFAVGFGVMCLPALLVEIDPIFRLTLAFGLWVLHLQPTAVGYWSASEKLRIEDEAKWQQNAVDWIADVEDRPPLWLREIDEEQ